MACQLGSCRAEDYRVTIQDRTGSTLLELDFEQLTWERTMDAISKATVRIAPGRCGDKFDLVRPWRHELHVSRNGVEQWAGPILIPSSCRSAIYIEALDVLQWSTRRVIHDAHSWDEVGSVEAARDLIVDGYAPDDPGVLQYLTTYGVGVVGGREYAANSKYVFDALTDLAKGAIDFTVVGRRIVVMPEGWELGRLPLITCDHFQGDVCGTDDGYATATKGIVTGGKDAAGGTVTGEFGGVDDYYGLIERLVSDTQIMRPATAADQARGLVNGANPPPFLIQPPQGSSLLPSTPICLEQLVPGVVLPVSLDCTARTTTQDMRLSKVSVSVDNSGETVAPLLTPIGLDAAA